MEKQRHGSVEAQWRGMQMRKATYNRRHEKVRKNKFSAVPRLGFQRRWSAKGLTFESLFDLRDKEVKAMETQVSGGMMALRL